MDWLYRLLRQGDGGGAWLFSKLPVNERWLRQRYCERASDGCNAQGFNEDSVAAKQEYCEVKRRCRIAICTESTFLPSIAHGVDDHSS